MSSNFVHDLVERRLNLLLISFSKVNNFSESRNVSVFCGFVGQVVKDADYDMGKVMPTGGAQEVASLVWPGPATLAA